jgi:sugar phosphate isomerase/epimerase
MNIPDTIHEFGLASDLYWDPLGEAEVRTAAEHGFSYFEIWGHSPWFDIRSSSMAADYKSLVENHGMRVRSVHAPCEAAWDISSEDEAVRRTSVEDVIHCLDRCREMGGELVVVHPGRAVAGAGEAADAELDRRIARSIKSFVDIQKAAADRGIRIALENQWGDEVGRYERQFLRLLETLDPNIVGICFDSSHANIAPGTYEMFEHIRHPIITTHLSDNNGQYDEHKPLFTCGIDWRMVFEFLTNRGYRGPWIMEVSNGGRDPFEELAKMGDSIGRVRKLVGEILENR